MSVQIAYKPDDFGPDAPHVALKVTSGRCAGTYGVYVATSARGHVRPVGPGRGIPTLAEAIRAADRCNAGMHGPSESGQIYS